MYYWLLVIIVLAVIEISTTNMVTIWYMASAFVALILSFFIDNQFILFGVFVVLGTILLITTKPLLEKKLVKKKEKTNLDRVVGMSGKVTEKISKGKNGEVLVDNKRWTAYSNTDIEVDEPVVILKIDGVKLEVKKEEE